LCNTSLCRAIRSTLTSTFAARHSSTVFGMRFARLPSEKPLTYAQLARRVSGPKSLRAVAQACAENPIALAIPCHRVMGNSGSMVCYRWGIERKQALINKEVAT
jgi:O-6-methylguanine DNA methyltransferase